MSAKSALTSTGEALMTSTSAEADEEQQRTIRERLGVKLFVSGLAPRVDANRLREAVERFGEVADAVVVHDRVTGRSRGFGFVTVVGTDVAAAVLDKLDGDPRLGLGQRVRVREAIE